MTTENTYETDKIDDSFAHVLVSSLSGTLVSLAAVWLWTATTF